MLRGGAGVVGRATCCRGWPEKVTPERSPERCRQGTLQIPGRELSQQRKLHVQRPREGLRLCVRGKRKKTDVTGAEKNGGQEAAEGQAEPAASGGRSRGYPSGVKPPRVPTVSRSRLPRHRAEPAAAGPALGGT